MEYRPELDGIRAYAVLAVLGFHSFLMMSKGAWMGVDVFFVLSGFLITSIVLVEFGRTGTVSMRTFYLRRLLRLYPALITVLLLGAVFFRELGATASAAGYARTAAAAAGYYQDFLLGLAGREDGRFGHTWSLAVEMQFYLVWPPLLLWLLVRKQPLLPWIFGLAAISFALLCLQVQELPGTELFAAGYYLPWTRSFELLIGAAVAVVSVNRPAPDPTATPSGRWRGWLIPVAIGFLVLSGGRWAIHLYPEAMIWQSPAIAVLTAVLILHLNRVRTKGVGRTLSWRPIVWLGQRSYAVYLFHYPVIHVLRDRYDVADASDMFLLAGGISIALAAISWRLIERPALAWGRRRMTRQTAQPTTPQPA